MSEITDEHMLEMLAQTKSYTLMVLRQGPNYESPGRDQIVWEHGRELQFGSRAVDVHVGRLRQKLGQAGAYIVTVRDVGYRFAVAEPHGFAANT